MFFFCRPTFPSRCWFASPYLTPPKQFGTRKNFPRSAPPPTSVLDPLAFVHQADRAAVETSLVSIFRQIRPVLVGKPEADGAHWRRALQTRALQNTPGGAATLTRHARATRTKVPLKQSLQDRAHQVEAPFSPTCVFR